MTKYNTVPLDKIKKIQKEYIGRNAQGAIAIMLREAYHNSLGNGATKVFITRIKFPDGSTYLAYLHNGKAFKNAADVKEALELYKSDMDGKGYYGAGGTLAGFLGDVNVDDKEVIFAGRTLEADQNFVAISQKKVADKNILQQQEVSDAFQNVCESLLQGEPIMVKDSALRWDEFTVAYFYRINESTQIITSKTMIQFFNIIDYKEYPKITFDVGKIEAGNSIAEGGKNYVDKSDYIASIRNNYCTDTKFSVPIINYPLTFNETSDEKTTIFLNGYIKLSVFPGLKAKKSVDDDNNNFFSIPKDGGHLHGSLKGAALTGVANSPIRVFQNFAYPGKDGSDVTRVVDDPVFYENKIGKYMDKLILPTPIGSQHENIEVNDQRYQILQDIFLTKKHKLEKNYVRSTAVMSPFVCLDVFLDVDSLDTLYELFEGTDELFIVNARKEFSEKLKDMFIHVSEMADDKEYYDEFIEYREYKKLMNNLLPEIQQDNLRVFDRDRITRTQRRLQRDYYFVATQETIDYLKSFLDKNPDTAEWINELPKSKSIPSKPGDRIHKIPVGVENMPAMLYNNETNEFIEGADIKLNFSNKNDIIFQNIDEDANYSITTTKYYRLDKTNGKPRKTIISENDYIKDRENSYPESLRGWKINGQSASIGMTFLLPPVVGSNVRKPNKPGDNKSKESHASYDDIYYNGEREDVYAKFTPYGFKLNANSLTIKKLFMDHGEGIGQHTCETLFSRIENAADQVFDPNNDAHFFIAQNTSPEGFDGKIEDLDEKYGNDPANMTLNQLIEYIIENDPSAAKLLKLHDEYLDKKESKNNSDKNEEEVSENALIEQV